MFDDLCYTRKEDGIVYIRKFNGPTGLRFNDLKRGLTPESCTVDLLSVTVGDWVGDRKKKGV